MISSEHAVRLADKTTALLIVDVQNGFINDYTRHIPAMVEPLQRRYTHVFATRFYNPDGSNYRRLLNWSRFDRGSQDFGLAFEPLEKTVILDKPIYSCVTPSFLYELKNRGVSTVHICGIDTDICVTACAVDLFENDLTPVVLTNACASHAGLTQHQHALETLRRFIGDDQLVSL